MPTCILATGRAFALGPAAIEEAMITLATLLRLFHFRPFEECAPNRNDNYTALQRRLLAYERSACIAHNFT